MKLQWIRFLFVIAVIFPGVSPTCDGQDHTNVLPFCTKGSRTGKTIYLDSSAVSKHELMTCSCSATLRPSDVYVHVDYKTKNNANCEFALYMGTQLYCRGYEQDVYEDISEIKIEKTLLGDSSICLGLEIRLLDTDDNQGKHANMTIDCSERKDAHVPHLPPDTATLHPDPHSTPRPVGSAPPRNDPAKGDQSSNSTTGNVGCPVCTCPACNCPACNCPECNCPLQEKTVQNVVNQNYSDGYSIGVLVGCSVGLFVGGCIIGVVVTLGVSFIRSER